MEEEEEKKYNTYSDEESEYDKEYQKGLEKFIQEHMDSYIDKCKTKLIFQDKKFSKFYKKYDKQKKISESNYKVFIVKNKVKNIEEACKEIVKKKEEKFGSDWVQRKLREIYPLFINHHPQFDEQFVVPVKEAYFWDDQINIIMKKCDFNLLNSQSDNILYVRLADFGISKILKKNDSNYTNSHTGLGTPLYVAPEVYTKKYNVKQVDIYSLGSTILQMLFTLCSKRNGIQKTAKELENQVRKSQKNQFENQINYLANQIKILESPNSEIKQHHYYILNIIKCMIRLDRNKRPTIEQILKAFQEKDSSNLPFVNEIEQELEGQQKNQSQLDKIQNQSAFIQKIDNDTSQQKSGVNNFSQEVSNNIYRQGDKFDEIEQIQNSDQDKFFYESQAQNTLNDEYYLKQGEQYLKNNIYPINTSLSKKNDISIENSSNGNYCILDQGIIE
ncbi:Protein kinase-like domain [Pseudocohnilembus persalinus]|uniref:non-specific serine/threonine protein kinase n=1 Tax=Pseudocohnilembus persalinus TaxID=266149 RepID=A0A0V0QYW4_PSEPJ|nr:Protein kinase-like domain [Pseudocohnilembus persalinus]|eukprot:KRX07446.1 Protein kinase-like domain [Pseudocohnilembus persalinus]